MTLSSTSLFHFTSNISTLKSILENDFLSLFCAESFVNIVADDLEDDPKYDKGIPMVCFCDIPLSKVNKHNKLYGNYAIGLTKEWAIRNKINPVIYTYKKSGLSSILFELINKLLKEKQNDAVESFNSLIQYIKPYSGRFTRNGKNYENLKFYDEREWRYIPKLLENKSDWIKGSDKKSLADTIKELNKMILEGNIEKTKLEFSASDIKYIIVKTDSDIHEIVNFFKNLKCKKYSINEIEILMTKITCLEDVIHDY